MKERPGKKLYFEKQPGPEERHQLLREYLSQVDQKKEYAYQQRLDEIDEDKKEIKKTLKEIEQIQKDNLETKKSKQQEFLRAIEEVKLERDEKDEIERKFIYDKPEKVFFPFTHGDSIEAARQQIREEQNNDLRNRTALLESQERAKMGSEKYDQVYGMNQDKVNPSIELERRLYP